MWHSSSALCQFFFIYNNDSAAFRVGSNSGHADLVLSPGAAPLLDEPLFRVGDQRQDGRDRDLGVGVGEDPPRFVDLLARAPVV